MLPSSSGPKHKQDTKTSRNPAAGRGKLCVLLAWVAVEVTLLAWLIRRP